MKAPLSKETTFLKRSPSYYFISTVDQIIWLNYTVHLIILSDIAAVVIGFDPVVYSSPESFTVALVKSKWWN